MIEILAPALQPQAEHNLAVRHRHDAEPADPVRARRTGIMLRRYDGAHLAMIAYQANIAETHLAGLWAAAAAEAYRQSHPLETR